MADQVPQLNNTVHFVGSVCLSDTTSVFKQLCASLPARIRRIPDGETGKRHAFVVFQQGVFTACPFVILPPFAPPTEKSENQTLENIRLGPVEYDDYALSSYFEFCKLRAEGIIPAGIRFQVSLATPINVVGNLIKPAWRPTIEPMYEAAILAALRRIQDNIPSNDLAIQFDLASEFAFLEGAASVPVDWFTPVKEGLIDRVLKVAAAVVDGVELGFHLCYGDFGHRHFMEPKDTSLLVEVGNALLAGSKRKVNWLHIPVPKDRSDRAYFEPLKQLKIKDTELYLGLLHMNDREGTRQRMKIGHEIIPNFGLATECGLGRASLPELNSILEIAREVTAGAVGE